MRIYLDNASTTPLTPKVQKTMTDVMANAFGNPSSIHHHGRKSRSVIETARKKIAENIGASVGEIFFTSSATEGNNTVLKKSILDLGVRRIISSPTEHHCVLHTLDAVAEYHPEVEIHFLDVDSEGFVDMEELELLLQNTEVKTLVSIMWGNNEIGTMQDVRQIGNLCKHYGALFHTDAVQVVAKFPVDVGASYFSFLTSSAHKFHGPKGCGFFYMNQENIIKPFMHGGAQERNMRAGTENLIGISGLAAAIEEAYDSLEERAASVRALKKRFKDGLIEEIPGIAFNGPEDCSRSLYHILSVSFPPAEKNELLVFNLDIAGICASSGSACSSGIETDSHVLRSIGHDSRRKTIRFSFSHLNTMEEIDRAVDLIKELTTASIPA